MARDRGTERGGEKRKTYIEMERERLMEREGREREAKMVGRWGTKWIEKYQDDREVPRQCGCQDLQTVERPGPAEGTLWPPVPLSLFTCS